MWLQSVYGSGVTTAGQLVTANVIQYNRIVLNTVHVDGALRKTYKNFHVHVHV